MPQAAASWLCSAAPGRPRTRHRSGSNRCHRPTAVTPKTAETCHAKLLEVLDLAERDPRLVAELARAQREFFGAAGRPAGAGAEAAAAATRFAEWFVLERESDVLGAVPVLALVRGRSDAAEVLELMRDSTAGVFRIESARDREAQATDLQDGEVVDLREQVPGTLARGDLLIGRLYSVGEGGHVPSVAATLHKDAEVLGEAIVRDLARLDLGRRLSQVEIEHVFLRGRQLVPDAAEALPPLERLEAEFETLLTKAGRSPHEVQALATALREAATPGQVMGPLLDELAFETDADLDEARRLMLQLWTALRRVGTPPPARPEPKRKRDEPRSVPGLGANIAKRIEQGLARHEDLEAMFADVENLFGERIDPDEPLEGSDGVEDGDLAGLVAEFLWETGNEHGELADVLASLVRQQRERPVPMLDAERLTGTDFLRLAVACYLAAAPADRVERIRAVGSALERFVGWLASAQEIELESGWNTVEAVLLAHADRVGAASLALSTKATAASPPSLWRVLATGEREFELTEIDSGTTHLVATSTEAARQLRVGDLLIAGIVPGARGSAALAGMVIVLPPGVEAVLG